MVTVSCMPTLANDIGLTMSFNMAVLVDNIIYILIF